MPQSLVKNLMHLIWSTKNRRPLITREIKTDLEGYIAGICKNFDSPALAIGAVEDHIHLLVNLSKNHPLKELVKKVKKESSGWIKKQGSSFQHFYWQRGYAGFSVMESMKDDVIKYIGNQWERHRRISFQEELREFFERYNIDYDEEYVWD